MTSRDEMVKLRERVRAANGPDREIDAQVYVACESYARGTWCEAYGGAVNVFKGANRINQFGPPGYSASIDAALALCERVLPGTNVFPEIMAAGQSACGLKLRSGATAFAWGATAPLALIDALLSALIQKDTSHVGS